MRHTSLKRGIKTLIEIVILIAVVSSGCLDYFAPLPSPAAPPSEVVEKFVSYNRAGNVGACYVLMSSEYKNSTKIDSFVEKIRHCDSPWIGYEFVEIRREKIEEGSASLEIIYLEKYDDQSLGDFNPLTKLTQKSKTKTINLVKEDGWKFTELYCELR